MQEIWKPIAGYEGRYEISNLGRVKSLARPVKLFKFKKRMMLPERMMVIHSQHQGYRVVWLRNTKTHKKFFIHRLVAEAFIPNPFGKNIVDHIDEDKGNNCVKNLQWATESENTQFYYDRKKAREYTKRAAYAAAAMPDPKFDAMLDHALSSI